MLLLYLYPPKSGIAKTRHAKVHGDITLSPLPLRLVFFVGEYRRGTSQTPCSVSLLIFYKSNESVYERCGMGPYANGGKSRVVEWVKRKTLRWSGHFERRKSEEFVNKEDVSESEGPRRGKPIVR